MIEKIDDYHYRFKGYHISLNYRNELEIQHIELGKVVATISNNDVIAIMLLILQTLEEVYTDSLYSDMSKILDSFNEHNVELNDATVKFLEFMVANQLSIIDEERSDSDG